MEEDFIKQTTAAIVERLNANAQFKGVSNLVDSDMVRFAFSTDEPHFLVGFEGKTLFALNHLVKKIFEIHCEKNNWKKTNFVVDVNDYQEKRMQELKNRAQIMAERARFFKSNIECPPMNPYERMIVHSFFSEVPDIKTESTGFGRDRRVVIKYVNQN
ncbi:MAG: hypothetical protein HYT29_01030 [Parcubacteria group bacterium]|nr:hypothetical protein [Parcubacteria group bacterium]